MSYDSPDSLPGGLEVEKPDAQGCRWCFVAYAEEDVQWIKESTPVALVVAIEEGSENGHKHFQGYVKWSSNKRFKWLVDRSFKVDGKHSIHWYRAKGPEWKCRRYIVDVEAYMRDEPRAHKKTQGDVIVDFGCEVMLDSDAPVDVRVVKALVDGAELYQVFRDNPMHFYHNSSKIEKLHSYITTWREMGVQYKPSGYSKEARRGYKRPRPEPDS